MSDKQQIAVIGLGVMGRNLALQFRDRGLDVHVGDPWPQALDWHPAGISVHAALDRLAAALRPPRLVLLMVKAGEPVDRLLDALCPHLAPGDIVVDGGNSFYRDTERRAGKLASAGLAFIGLGISGGASGARHGAAMMAGGPLGVWETSASRLTLASATSQLGPAIAWFGDGGAGHFVKMVHNGIEYAVMQAIAEVYDVLRRGAGLPPGEIGDTFDGWSRSTSAGFLIEVTAACLKTADPGTGKALVDVILDVAGQKGTGSWSVAAGLDFGIPVPAIAEAVAARQVSALQAIRAKTGRERAGAQSTAVVDANAKSKLIDDLRAAYDGSVLASLAQGLHLLTAAATANGWSIAPGDIARVWNAGSILRMHALDQLVAAASQTPPPDHLLSARSANAWIDARDDGWRRSLTLAIELGIPTPVMSGCRAYVDALHSTRLPTALIQAQRDHFGAHGFGRLDQPGAHHGPWHTPEMAGDT